MDTNKVSVKQSYDLIRAQMNSKVINNLKQVLKQYGEFLSKQNVAYNNLQQVSLVKACEIINSSLNQYLTKKQAAADSENSKDLIKAMSSVITEMGGSLFQNLRVYRDMLYTKQNRKDRLLNCFRGQLFKAMANKDQDRGAAYI